MNLLVSQPALDDSDPSFITRNHLQSSPELPHKSSSGVQSSSPRFSVTIASDIMSFCSATCSTSLVSCLFSHNLCKAVVPFDDLTKAWSPLECSCAISCFCPSGEGSHNSAMLDSSIPGSGSGPARDIATSLLLLPAASLLPPSCRPFHLPPSLPFFLFLCRAHPLALSVRLSLYALLAPGPLIYVCPKHDLFAMASP